jgi:hypothetical protein
MFFLNVGYRWDLATSVDEVRGGVFLASGNNTLRFGRVARPELKHVLLDPQVYLAGLDPDTCGKVCARLGSHPWFCIPDLPEFDSNEGGVRAWQKEAEKAILKHWKGSPPQGAQVALSARRALEGQLNFGCTHILLPSPLLDEREDEAATLGEWLDAGLEEAEALEVGQPLLATIALSESLLTPQAFVPSGFLDAVVDQVTSRQGIDGVYIVVALQGASAHPFETALAVHRAYATLAARFREAGCEQVMTNFADVAGLAYFGIGATDFATGASQSLRRLCLAGFRDEGGGIAVPHLYSHSSVAEFSSEEDLKPIVAKGLLHRIEDETSYSQVLFEALRDGKSAGTVPAWAESQNNITAAQRHFVARMSLEATSMQKLGTPAKRLGSVRRWLEDADANVLYLAKRLGGSGGGGRFAPCGDWLEIVNSVAA